MVWLFEHTAKFPRHERFRLTKRIDDALFDFHACLVRATAAKDVRTMLVEADAHLNLLRAYLRITVELKYITPNQYQYAAEHTAELGRLLGGWMKQRDQSGA